VNLSLRNGPRLLQARARPAWKTAIMEASAGLARDRSCRQLLGLFIAQALHDGMSAVKLGVDRSTQRVYLRYYGPVGVPEARWWGMTAPPPQAYLGLVKAVVAAMELAPGLDPPGTICARINRRAVDVRVEFKRSDYAWQYRFTPGANEAAVLTEGDSTWTDYLGQQPYVDYTIDEGQPSEVMRYLPGFGVHAQQGVQGGTAGGTGVSPVFLHGDPPLTQQVPSRGTAREASDELGSCCCVKGLTPSTMMTTDTSATVVSRVAYTAFGDPLTPDGQGGRRVGFPPGLGGVGEPLGTRYQYEGGWGYDSGAWGPGPGREGAVGGPLALWGENTTLPPVTLQHVGWRWYQPSIGRFVQRDPIGLRGGLNVYAYVENDPLVELDAEGLGPVKTPWGWRDPGTGRWTKPPWLWRKVPRWITYKLIYDVELEGFRRLYCVMGEPYPGDPGDQLWDLLEQLRRLQEQNARNRRQRGGRPDVFPPAPRRDPPACMGHVL